MPKKTIIIRKLENLENLPHREVVENSSNGPDDQQIRFDDYLILKLTENSPVPTKQNESSHVDVTTCFTF